MFIVNRIIVVTIGTILLGGTLFFSAVDFIEDKISFYKIKSALHNADINPNDSTIRYQRLFSINNNKFELIQLNRITSDDERYNGTVLKIKNLTDNTCKIDSSLFKQLFDQYDFIEISNVNLKPTEETEVYLAYKNLAFRGYHTKSTRHTSLLMLDKYSSLPEEFQVYKMINKLLSDEYISLDWEFTAERIARLEKDSSNSIYASVDLQKLLSLKINIEHQMLLVELRFCNLCPKNNTVDKNQKPDTENHILTPGTRQNSGINLQKIVICGRFM